MLRKGPLKNPMKLSLKSISRLALVLCLCLCILLNWQTIAWANFDDDHFDGNIFSLYAGNGSLLPPKITLEQALRNDRPTLLTFYVEDSRDCKEFASVISRVQAYYGKVTDIIAITADTLLNDRNYSAQEPGYYYKGRLPQTVLFDNQGKVVFNQTGIVPFETLDDRYREIFDLLPRSESAELKRRPLNEVNATMVE